jgi:hypothetical protein
LKSIDQWDRLATVRLGSGLVVGYRSLVAISEAQVAFVPQLRAQIVAVVAADFGVSERGTGAGAEKKPGGRGVSNVTSGRAGHVGPTVFAAFADDGAHADLAIEFRCG